jgi:hypothetical protein
MPLSPAPRLEKLGTARLTAAATSLTLDIPAREVLIVQGLVTGLSASDTVAMRFNGATTNYWYRTLHAVQGVATVTNGQAVSTTQILLDQIAGTGALVFRCEISNRLATSKTMTHRSQRSTGSAATAGGLHLTCGGEWVNTTAQITQIQIKSTGGTATLSADTHFAVFGSNV